MKRLVCLLSFILLLLNPFPLPAPVLASDCPDLPDVTQVGISVIGGKTYMAGLENPEAIEQFKTWEYEDAWTEQWYIEAPFDVQPDYNILISNDDDNRLEWVAQVYVSSTDAFTGYPAFYDWDWDAPISDDGSKHPSCWLKMDMRQLWELIEIIKQSQ